MAWAAFRYLGAAWLVCVLGDGLFCAWSRTLRTSMGVTTVTASVMPAARPAGKRDEWSTIIETMNRDAEKEQGAVESSLGVLPRKMP